MNLFPRTRAEGRQMRTMRSVRIAVAAWCSLFAATSLFAQAPSLASFNPHAKTKTKAEAQSANAAQKVAPTTAPQSPPPADAREKEREFVEPIITEETLPNEVGEWDLRWSSEWAKEAGNDRSGRLRRAQLFFGILKNLGGEIDLPMAYRRATS